LASTVTIFFIQATVRRYTTANQARRIEQERQAENLRSDLQRDLAVQKLQIANAASEERAAEKRIIRRTAQQQREEAMQHSIVSVSAKQLISFLA
jgi:hypothetical protein